jgi:hypothetical protein
MYPEIDPAVSYNGSPKKYKYGKPFILNEQKT